MRVKLFLIFLLLPLSLLAESRPVTGNNLPYFQQPASQVPYACYRGTVPVSVGKLSDHTLAAGVDWSEVAPDSESAGLLEQWKKAKKKYKKLSRKYARSTSLLARSKVKSAKQVAKNKKSLCSGFESVRITCAQLPSLPLPTALPTMTPTSPFPGTPGATASPTPLESPTNTATPTPTRTITPTRTPTPTLTPTPTMTGTIPAVHSVTVNPPTDLTMQREEGAVFEALPSGGVGPFTYRWLINGTPAANGASSLGTIVGAESDLLNISNLTLAAPAGTPTPVSAIVSVEVTDAVGRMVGGPSRTLNVDGNSTVDDAVGPKRSVQTTITTNVSPPSITLNWIRRPTDTGNTTIRRLTDLNQISWPAPIATLAYANTTYTDTNVTVGARYEYKVSNNTGYQSYIQSCINCPANRSQGSTLILVDSEVESGLNAELTRLESDLAGDGWRVFRQSISRSATPPQIKDEIVTLRNEDAPDLKSVVIIGHIATPFSGSCSPDGHAAKAFPADIYYSDLTGTWTDQTIDVAYNRPGDGIFDQCSIPSDGSAALQVGRIDFNGMPLFVQAPESSLDSEVRLLRQYLDKDHLYRHNLLDFERRAVFHDEWNSTAPGIVPAYRSWPAILGPEKIYQVDWTSLINIWRRHSFQWSYVGGAGWSSCQGINGGASTTDFRNYTAHAVFQLSFGSYFVDWSCQNSYLRAPLANNGDGLASIWAGSRPYYYFHSMGLGDSIGEAVRRSQNNQTRYDTAYSRASWMALMGDPTLRNDPMSGAEYLEASRVGPNEVELSWVESIDPEVLGYEVYRSPDMGSEFELISPQMMDATTFTDNAAPAGQNIYMVRAIKLQTTPSGSYYNMSQGTFDSVN